jgi:capsular polysaccharide biosynthesis protein
MELRRYVRLLRQRILLVVLAVMLGVGAGYLATNRTPRYQAVASIYVGSRQFSGVAGSTDASAAMDRVVQTFAALIRTQPVATAAIQLSHAPRTPDQVVSATIALAVPNTNYIVVAVSDRDPVVAQSLANGLAAGFVSQVQSLEPGTAGPGTSPVTSVFQQAGRPTLGRATSTKRNLALGGLAGLAAGVALVALLNYVDITVKRPEDVEASIGTLVIGTIPFAPQ